MLELVKQKLSCLIHQDVATLKVCGTFSHTSGHLSFHFQNLLPSPALALSMSKSPVGSIMFVKFLSFLPQDCAQSGWGCQVGFWSGDHPGSLCMTSPLSSAGSLVSFHNSRTAVVGNQDLVMDNQVSVCVKQWPTPLTYSAYLFGLFWDCHVESNKTAKPFSEG